MCYWVNNLFGGKVCHHCDILRILKKAKNLVLSIGFIKCLQHKQVILYTEYYQAAPTDLLENLNDVL